MDYFYKGTKVINSNDLSILNIKGRGVAISVNIYVVQSTGPGEGGYIKVKDIHNGKTINMKKDSLIPVY